MDKILVRGLKIFAYHGVNEEEKIDGQNFILDIDAFVDIGVPCVSDNVDDTVSYAKIIKETTRIFTSQKDDLLERAAQRVADGLFESFGRIQSLRILLKKPEAPIKADFDYVGVEIYRNRGNTNE
ncbi:MAG: dihydroneopterin aldolase [Clostridia bacterium]|nr:dihydroneopterin aldolase [Clostridia bacterium]